MKRISKHKMEKKDIFAPLALGLGATRRAAVLLLVMMLTTATAWAQSGSCGDVTWELTGSTLTISGSGAMWDYGDPSEQPWKDYRSSIKTVVIGSGVTSIGNYTFAYCTGLTSINIPAGVTSIGDNAFWNCSNLATVTFAEDSQLATIGISAFSTCRGLASVEIPASVTSIGNNAFSTCNGLGSVTFAEGSQLTSIGNNAFRLCSNLTSITIPASVTSIGSYVFQNCNLASMTVEDGNTVYDSRNGCNAIIEKSTNTLIIGCKNSTIPAGVTSIGAWAFGGTGLTSIEIPASVTSIGVSAFYGCSVMTSIEIPASVTSIGGSAFYGCSGLTSIEIPAGVTSISGVAFRNCSNLATVTVYAPSCTLGDKAFLNCDKLTNIYVFSNLVGNYKGAEHWSTYADKITAIEGIALADNADNSSLITAANGSTLNVTLQGRTLQAGSWNTFAVPFSMAIPNGWTVKELTGATDDGSTLTLTFGDAASIEAGKPYLVQVESAVENPVFNNVSVSSTPAPSVFANVISFVPTFGLTALPEGKENILFLATGNTLKHPSAESQNLKGFRAYFQLPGGANQVRAFRMDFGDNVTGVEAVQGSRFKFQGSDAWYTLDGLKFSGKPSKRGLYINNGKKVVIK
jgi:hypothetical protein